MTTYTEWLKSASFSLKQIGSSSPYLDALLLLEFTVHKTPEYIKAYPDTHLTIREHTKINNLLKRRCELEPMAYILNNKEFYGRSFYVNKNVLVPRPESETIIDYVKLAVETSGFNKPAIIDVGTGSGCLGITTKLELPNSQVTLVDISSKALRVAQKNAKILKAEVIIKKSDLLNYYKNESVKFDIVVANLPYLDKSWPTSKETDFEPPISLYAKLNGLELINKLLKKIKFHLKNSGYVIIEADPKSHPEVIKSAKKLADLDLVVNDKFVLLFKAR